MTATGTKPAAKELREAEMGIVLPHRAPFDGRESRNRKIAYLNRLWERRTTLAKFVAWGAAASALIAVLIPSQYSSVTRLMPPDSAQGQGMTMLAAMAGKAAGGALGELGADLFSMKNSGELFAGVLLSRTVQDSLVGKFDLRHVYGVRKQVDARKELTRNTDVSIDRKSGILTIQVTDHDPKRACAMAEEYVVQLNSVVTQLNTSSAHRERVFLEDRLQQVKVELESAEKDFSQFSSKNGAIDIKEQGRAMVEAAAALEGELVAAQTELQGMRQIYTDENVRVRAIQARISELRRQLDKMGGKPQPESAQDSEESDLYPSIRKLPLLGVTYADLYRRMKVEEAIFETLTQQYELAKVQEAKEVPSVKVLDAADVPEKKVFPPRVLITLTGILLAFAIGVLWIFGSDRWKGIDPRDPGKLLILDVYSTMKPSMAMAGQRGSGLFARVRRLFDRVNTDAAPAENEP